MHDDYPIGGARADGDERREAERKGQYDKPTNPGMNIFERWEYVNQQRHERGLPKLSFSEYADDTFESTVTKPTPLAEDN